MDRIQLSHNFYLNEFTDSWSAKRRGIDMSVEVGSPVFDNLKRLCTTVLQPLRDALGPVHITSGYRPEALNTAIGGSPTSQHMLGQAADIVVTGHTPLQVAQWIRDNVDGYDQLIHEFGRWVHVSVPSPGDVARMEDLTSVHTYRTVYLSGLLSMDDARRSLTA